MSELSFLLDILLNHKIPKCTKDIIRERIKEIEIRSNQPQITNNHGPITYTARPPKTAQSPSTQRILDEMAKEGSMNPTISIVATEPEIPANQTMPNQIAQTPATAAALAARQEAIAIAISGKEERGRTSPRKF